MLSLNSDVDFCYTEFLVTGLSMKLLQSTAAMFTRLIRGIDTG